MILSVVLFTGCTASTINLNNTNDSKVEGNEKIVREVKENEKENDDKRNVDENELSEANSDLDSEPDTNDKEQEDKKEKEINLQEIKPNEAGKVMIVMYHALGDEEKDFVRTRENFKKDLELLYEKGYRLISLNDYINNDIDIEAGKTPVVITFDDGNNSDFNIIEENGEKKVDPNCAVGILEDFYKEHPDFGLEATFYIYGRNPFRQKDLIDYKLKYIINKGMDIGNHTSGHDKLSVLSAEDIQKTLAENVKYIKQYLPDYEVNTLALPYGARPKSEEKRNYLYNGSFDGIEYQNIGALAVGANPAHSSIHKEFNHRYIPRVHGSSGEWGIRFWLEYFDKHPEKRYISDGDQDTVTIQEHQRDVVDETKIGDKKLRIYKLEKK
jgi:peptidoglycan/xylan/chitin deacetylase (PgdA/CDA1 family)